MALIGYTICPVCKGERTTADSRKCEKCGGSGQVPVFTEDEKPQKSSAASA